MVLLDNQASNGPATLPDEGLSYVHPAAGKKFLLKDAVETAGDVLLGADVMEREGGWNLLCNSSTTWDPFRTTCTRAISLPSWSDIKASRRPITSPRNTTRSATTFPILIWVWSPGLRKKISIGALKIGTAVTTALFFTPALIGSNLAADGRLILAFFMRRDHWLRMSRR